MRIESREERELKWPGKEGGGACTATACPKRVVLQAPVELKDLQHPRHTPSAFFPALSSPLLYRFLLCAWFSCLFFREVPRLSKGKRDLSRYLVAFVAGIVVATASAPFFFFFRGHQAPSRHRRFRTIFFCARLCRPNEDSSPFFVMTSSSLFFEGNVTRKQSPLLPKRVR